MAIQDGARDSVFRSTHPSWMRAQRVVRLPMSEEHVSPLPMSEPSRERSLAGSIRRLFEDGRSDCVPNAITSDLPISVLVTIEALREVAVDAALRVLSLVEDGSSDGSEIAEAQQRIDLLRFAAREAARASDAVRRRAMQLSATQQRDGSRS